LWEIFRPKSKEENPYTSASIERKWEDQSNQQHNTS
jgi:hypothetical protein